MEDSTRVAELPGGQEQVYFWRSDHEALFLRNAAGAQHYEAICLDTNTRTESPLTAFNARCSAQMPGDPMRMHFVDEAGKPARPSEIVYFPPPCELSPDGTWLLWQSGKPGRTSWIASTLDGHRQAMWRQARSESATMTWMPDSLSWIELVQNPENDVSRFTRAIVHNVETPRISQTIRLAGVSNGRVLGISYRGDILIQNDWYDPQPLRSDVVLSACGLDPSVSLTREHTITLPQPSEIYDISLSPQRDRLAWTLCNAVWLGTKGAVVSVWISSLMGEDMRQVMSTEIAAAQTGSGEQDVPCAGIDGLRWLPDGKRLSFLYKNGLYIIAAD